MKALLAAALFALAFTAPTHAANFIARLEGTQEVPPVDTTAAGGAVLTVDLLSRAFSLTGAISNLVFTPTAAHIHGPAPVGQNGPVLFPLSFNAEPEGPLGADGFLTEEQLDWLQSGLLYVNVHTTEHPGGEIRGQLALVPEPGTCALIAGLGLCAFAAARRRRA
jgi:hypothetical protein